MGTCQLVQDGKKCGVQGVCSNGGTFLQESKGSVNHNQGMCKPCAFFHREEGCTNAENCEYCHLCPPGEIIRRKKNKQTLKKLLQQHNNLFLGGANRQVNQMMFNSNDIPAVIDWLKQNQDDLGNVN